MHIRRGRFVRFPRGEDARQAGFTDQKWPHGFAEEVAVMPLVAAAPLLRDAVAQHYAIGAYNVFNAETVGAVVQGAEQAGCPVIVSLNEPDLEFMGAEVAAAVARLEADRVKIPVCLQLDHGLSLVTVAQALRAGFTAVMIDPSGCIPSEAERVVRRVVAMCHAIGVSVESMSGHLPLAAEADAGPRRIRPSGGGPRFTGEVDLSTTRLAEGGPAPVELTDPVKARAFVAATGIDALAVSVGTEHGSYLVGRRPRVDLDRLAEIAAMVEVPLVLHGGSGVDPAQLAGICTNRVGQVNIGAALRVVYRQALFSAWQDPLADVTEALGAANLAVRDFVATKSSELAG